MFDLHAHVIRSSRFFRSAASPEETPRTLLEAGITTIRALPLTSESALGWAARVHDGSLVGPTIAVERTMTPRSEPRLRSRSRDDSAGYNRVFAPPRMRG